MHRWAKLIGLGVVLFSWLAVCGLPRAAAADCGTWLQTAASPDGRLQVAIDRSGSGADCQGGVSVSNHTALWLPGSTGYTLALTQANVQNTQAAWDAPLPADYLLPILPHGLNLTPTDASVPADLMLSGSITPAAIGIDSALFFINAVLATQPIPCTVPTTATATVALRLSALFDTVVSRAVKFDPAGVRQELQTVLPTFVDQARDAFTGIGMSCVADAFDKASKKFSSEVGKAGTILKLAWEYANWLPVEVIDYFRTDANPATVTLAYTPARQARAAQPAPSTPAVTPKPAVSHGPAAIDHTDMDDYCIGKWGQGVSALQLNVVGRVGCKVGQNTIEFSAPDVCAWKYGVAAAVVTPSPSGDVFQYGCAAKDQTPLPALFDAQSYPPACPAPVDRTLLQGAGTNVFIYLSGGRHAIPDATTQQTRFPSLTIQHLDDQCLAAIPTSTPIESVNLAASTPAATPTVPPGALGVVNLADVNAFCVVRFGAGSKYQPGNATTPPQCIGGQTGGVLLPSEVCQAKFGSMPARTEPVSVGNGPLAGWACYGSAAPATATSTSTSRGSGNAVSTTGSLIGKWVVTSCTPSPDLPSGISICEGHDIGVPGSTWEFLTGGIFIVTYNNIYGKIESNQGSYRVLDATRVSIDTTDQPVNTDLYTYQISGQTLMLTLPNFAQLTLRAQ